SLKYRPHDALAYDLWAGIHNEMGNSDAALPLYRFAATVNELNEGPARSYFAACQIAGKQSTALKMLVDRFDRFAAKSSQPTRSLIWALERIDRTTDAEKVLRKGIKLRRDDGEMLLYAADFFGRYNRQGEAYKCLELAKGKCHQNTWLHAAALLQTYEGKLEEALQSWQFVLREDPQNQGAVNRVAELLADVKDPAHAIDFIREQIARFPHSVNQRMLLIDWLRREEQQDELEKELETFTQRHPDDAWAMRELAMLRCEQRRYDEAETLTMRAAEIDLRHPAVSYILGLCDKGRGQLEQAKEHFRESLRIDVDYDHATYMLFACCETSAERQPELDFLYSELQSQTIHGDGLLTYRSFASTTTDSDGLLKQLQRGLDSRPDLWQSWSAYMSQLSEMGRHEEALDVSRRASGRFPMLPRIWIDRSRAHAQCGDIDGEIESLNTALQINPNWGDAVRLLCDAYEKTGELDKARKEIERTIAAEPRDVRNHATLATLLWKQEHKDDAIAQLQRTICWEASKRLSRWSRYS
ncbi:MAG: tetratricopeptide repeat protein, partial [Planctomycetota bacterium]